MPSTRTSQPFNLGPRICQPPPWPRISLTLAWLLTWTLAASNSVIARQPQQAPAPREGMPSSRAPSSNAPPSMGTGGNAAGVNASGAAAAGVPAGGVSPSGNGAAGAATANSATVNPIFVVPARTRIPLVLVNSVSTKNSQPGDRVYLQTAFPIADSGRIVIPEGSYVTGTVTEVKRPGRVKGRGEIYVRFDTLMLRNGVHRDFRGTVSAVDGSQPNLSEKEGQIEGDSSKAQDAAVIVGPGSTGAIIGAAADSGRGALIGGGAGAAAGMIGVLLTRGNEVQLLRGTSLEMQLDRELRYALSELNFEDSPSAGPLPTPPPQGGGSLGRGSSFPKTSGPFPRPF